MAVVINLISVSCTCLIQLCACVAGNYCVGGSEGKERGHGRIVVSEFNGKSGDDCGWDVLKTVEIPSKAAFMDYSGMAFRGNKVSRRVSTLGFRVQGLGV